MFGRFKKGELPKLEREYGQLMERARDAQRAGDIRGYAEWIEKSEVVGRRLDELKREQAGSEGA